MELNSVDLCTSQEPSVDFSRDWMQLSSRGELTCTFITRLSQTKAGYRQGRWWMVCRPCLSFPVSQRCCNLLKESHHSLHQLLATQHSCIRCRWAPLTHLHALGHSQLLSQGPGHYNWGPSLGSQRWHSCFMIHSKSIVIQRMVKSPIILAYWVLLVSEGHIKRF